MPDAKKMAGPETAESKTSECHHRSEFRARHSPDSLSIKLLRDNKGPQTRFFFEAIPVNAGVLPILPVDFGLQFRSSPNWFNEDQRSQLLRFIYEIVTTILESLKINA